MSERSLHQIYLALHTRHEMVISGLIDESEYVSGIRGLELAGSEAVVEEKTVKTATDLRSPEVSDVNIESTITGVGEEAKAQVIISWNTDEPSTTQVEYGEGTGSEYVLKTQEDASMIKNHVVTIPDLKPANIYHLRVVSKDKAGNVGTSFDSVVITPKATKSALNLVIESLSKTFGFLGK